MSLFGSRTPRIDWLHHPAFTGRIGMTKCPGTWRGPAALGDDVAAIRAEGASTLVSLIEDEELRLIGVEMLGNAVARRRLAWYHLPIRDFGVPDFGFENAWQEVGPALRQRLSNSESIVMHCYAGLGRTGLVAARLLVEFGEGPFPAIDRVRAVRPGAIQTADQEAYVLKLGSRHRHPAMP